MSKKSVQKESNKTMLARVKAEMAVPRMTKSARDADTRLVTAKRRGRSEPRRGPASA